MKAQLYTSAGEKKSEIELPALFETPIREDMILKVFEAEKEAQPYSQDPRAGRKHSASGVIRHARHKWKGHYGKGISRIPRKAMWRRGTQFFWVAAEVSAARGGRSVHSHTIARYPRKINKKELVFALNSALAATADKQLIEKRYASLKSISHAPFVIESVPAKTKELVLSLKKIFGDAFSLVLKEKSVRAGKGKRRGRKYKSTAGLLLITAIDENVKFKGVEVKSAREVSVADLYPLGRLALFTRKAIDELAKEAKK